MIESEKGIIGCILLDSDCLNEIYRDLPIEAFTNEFNRDCYETMLAMFDNGQHIDLISLAGRLENEHLDKPTILQNLNECLQATTSSVAVGSFAKELIAEHKARKLKRLIEGVSLIPNEIDFTIGQLMTELEVMNDNRKEDTRHIRDIVAMHKDNYFREVDKKLIKTGFYKLDDTLGGLEGGDITIIGARPSVGKSALVTQIIANVASRNARVGYFNLEMNESQVYERFVSRMAKLSLTRVRRAKTFLGGEEEAFAKANEQLSNYDVVISTGSKSVRDIKTASRHMKFDLIVIDYLQLIKADKSFANRASEVGEVSKAIKGLAMELNVPIILLSQLSRGVESRDVKEPQLSDLRESGDIEQDASNVIFIWNLSDDKRCKGMSVAKNRQGELTKIGLEFDGEHMEFRERQEEFYQWQKTVKNGEKMREQMAENNPFDDWR